MTQPDSTPDRPGPPQKATSTWLPVAVLLAAFIGIGLILYAPALEGPFVSDDQHYVWKNAYLHELSWSNLREILDPTGPVVLVVENYAPVHLLLHAVEWQAFGMEVLGYHVVNVLLHAGAALLFVLLLAREGVPRGWAVAGGTLFLVHPANVEAVAWISQLKSPAALGLALGALLAHPRRPWLGVVLFALALLAKPTAAFAFPVVVAIGWVKYRAGRSGSGPQRELGSPDWRWPWVAVWAATLAGFAWLEVSAFAHTAGTAPLVYEDGGVRFRSSFANAGRYLLTAVSGRGLSTFHEPPPAEGWFDPWFLGSLAILAALVARSVVVLRRGSSESVWWIFAAASYAPFCGIIALPFAMADRYLYFVLPGLIGACLLALRPLGSASRRAGSVSRQAGSLSRLAPISRPLGAAAVVALALVFAVQSHARARVWSSESRMMADAVMHYPDGRAASLARALRAAEGGDVETTVNALRVARRKGFNRLDQLLYDPVYAPYQQHPKFRALLEEVATEWIDRIQDRGPRSQVDFHLLALGRLVRGEIDAAIEALERALEAGGPADDQVRRDLDHLRHRRQIERRQPPGSD